MKSMQLSELKTSIRFSKRHQRDIKKLLRFYKADVPDKVRIFYEKDGR